MSILSTVFYIFLGCLIIAVSLGLLVFIGKTFYATIGVLIATLISIPYCFYLGTYIYQHNLPRNYRKRDNPKETLRDATRFYNDILHFRKPTFD